jgi:hypothetical protein
VTTRSEGPISDPLFAALEASAAELEAFGAPDAAQGLREAIRRARAELEAWWNTPLSLADAGEWGGYSEGQLRRLIREGKITQAPDGGIRRLDVPVRPGHRLPLGLEPAAVAERGFVSQVVRHRQLSAS